MILASKCPICFNEDIPDNIAHWNTIYLRWQVQCSICKWWSFMDDWERNTTADNIDKLSSDWNCK